MADKTDKEKWVMMQAGDQNSLEEIYRNHIDAIIKLGYKLNASSTQIEETIQELFLRIWNNRTNLTVPNNVRIYLLASFRNNLIKAINNDRNYDKISLDQMTADLVDLDSIDGAEGANSTKVLQNAIERLPARQKEIIFLKYFQNIKINDISSIMKMKPQSASNLLQRAIKNLSTLLK